MERYDGRVYHVVVRRDPEDARYWLADVDGLDGAHTFARNLESLDQYVREVIVLAADLPDDADKQLRLEWEYRTGDAALDDEAAELRAKREAIEAQARELAERTATLARRLVAEDRYSIRDAGALLGISPQRVSQVVPQPAKRSARKVAAKTVTGRRAAVVGKRVAVKANPSKRVGNVA